MKIKNISNILSRMIDLTLINTTELNDFSDGSIIGSIYEAVAMELEQYYVLGRENIFWGIGEGIYEAFGFSRQQARRAYGNIDLHFHTQLRDGILIPRGSRFFIRSHTGRPMYETLEDYYAPAGANKLTIEVFCTQPGEVGNAQTGMIDGASNSIVNLKEVHQPEPILTGKELEPLHKVKQRFRTFVDTRGRATNKALDYATRTVEDVSGVYIRESTGFVEVFAHDANGNLSNNLKNEIAVAIDDYRPTGIRLDIKPVTKRKLDVHTYVQLRDVSRLNSAFREEIELTVYNYLASMEAGEDLIRKDLVQQIMNVDDYAIYDIKIEGFADNVRVENHELIRPGKVSVEFTELKD